MQRRVNIAAALVHDPEIIFMDEPTVGLDPVSRTAIWKIIEDLKARGKTIVLTTHYMEEAEALSDRVAIVDHGKVIAVGTTDELIRATGVKTALNIVVAGDGAACVEPLRALPEVKETSAEDGRLRVYAESFGARLAVPITMHGEDLAPRLPLAAETALFRIAQEALANAVKHARARNIEVALGATPERVTLTIYDDGVGFDAEHTMPAGSHWGLATMRERADAVGATLRMESAPGRGVHVSVEVPRRAA